jgi:PAS domain S-box-containing protein
MSANVLAPAGIPAREAFGASGSNGDSLPRSELELYDFFENALVPFHWVGPDGIILRANRAELNLLGYSRDEYVGRHIADFHVDAEVSDDILRRLHAHEELRGREARLRCRDGSIRHVLIDANVFREDGEFVHTRCMMRDVTDHKRSDQALRDSEARLRQIIDALPAAVYTTDASGRLTHYNAACVEFSGRVPELGTDHWCVTWKLYHPDGTPMPHDTCPMAIALKEGRIVRGAEAIAERPDGSRIWFQPYPTPLLDESGRIVGGINMLVDITERKAGEEALRAADQRKDEFLATLAHELRNPLAAVRNGLQLMQLAPDDVDAVAESRGIMERQVEQLVRLVDDLLDVSRISRGRIELRRERIDLARIIENAVELARPLLQQAGHRLTVSLPQQPLELHGDEVRLSQVFSNLLNNACKYTPREGEIRLTAAREQGQVTVMVEDTGIGMPPEMLNRVFEMFTQIDDTLERSQGGLGIGLTLVKRLVELHGGSVEAHSDGRDRGSRFSVRLPVAEPAHSGSAAVRHDAQPEPLRRRVLVVDDNRDSAAMMARLLKALGSDARMAHDGLAALAVADEFRPDVVLLDIGMPRLNGYDTARRIREQGWGRAMQLIAMTGWGQDADRQRAAEAGFDHHLVKPVSLKELRAVLSARPSAGKS